MGKILFYKLQALGNDFILLDQRPKAGNKKINYSVFAKKYCDRRFGIGADGLLVVEPSRKADFRMRIFNADGSEAEMCGNGARCAALYSARRKAQGAKRKSKRLKFETIAGIIEAEVKNDTVKIKMTDPAEIRLDFPIDARGRKIRANFINTGVPHAVVFVEGLNGIDVETIGREIRNHPFFAPKGTNVNFVEISGDQKIVLRTYERGVEAETLACGTGTVASSIISDISVNGLVSRKSNFIEAKTKSGEALKVHFDIEGKMVKNVWLEGKSQLVFEGTIKNV